MFIIIKMRAFPVTLPWNPNCKSSITGIRNMFRHSFKILIHILHVLASACVNDHSYYVKNKGKLLPIGWA